MSDQQQTAIERLQQIMTALMEQLLQESLQNVDEAMDEWKAGSAGVFETHAELLRHAAKAERVAERMALIDLDNAGSLLRDAYDVNLVSREEFVGFVGAQPEDVSPSPPLSEDSSLDGAPDKRSLVEELLGTGPVLLHIDARHTLAQVPTQFCDDPKLVLRFGYDLSPAIIDLSIDDEGIYGTLTFGGVPTRCVLPWGCIYSVVCETDQKGMVWPEDVPECVVNELGGRSSEAEDAEKESSKPLMSIDSSDRKGSGPSSTPPEPSSPSGRGGHLTLVK